MSVVLACYNASAYIGDAIKSILRQTYPNIELIIIDDGSTDDSSSIIRNFIAIDNRIRLLQNLKNQGLISSLNRGIAASSGKYIARMDADDISMYNRIELQVSYMESHPSVGILGTFVEIFGPKERVRRWIQPVSHENIKACSFTMSPFFHPTVMMRKDILKMHNLVYDDCFYRAEDHSLWINILDFTEGANLPSALVRHRILEGSETYLADQDRHQRRIILKRIHQLALQRLNIILSEEEQLLYSCSMVKADIGLIKNKDISDLIELFNKIINAARRSNYVNPYNLKFYLSLRLIAVFFYSKSYWNIRQLLRALTSSYFYFGFIMMFKRKWRL